jgi:hypothetical protein
MSYFPTIPDETAFTAGASPVTPIAGVYNDSLAAVTSGESGSLRITEKRAAHVNLRSETGTELATSAAPLRVDPTGTTKQPVTLFDSAGTAIVLSSGRLLVDGSGVTQPISAASLPLPTGASTSAKQPAIGTAGTPSADVLSVQGVASMTALSENLTQLGGTAIDTNSGNKSAGTQRVVLATDQPVWPSVMYSGGVAHPPLVGNISSGTIVLNSTTPVTVLTGAPGYYIQSIVAQLDQAAFNSNGVPNITALNISDSSFGIFYQIRYFMVGASITPLNNSTDVTQSTPPAFFWNNKVANSSLSLVLSQNISGAMVVVINYGLCSFVG